jgi:uncharacterized membrane protein YphA (DoxX/SURF4 family)/negative regulator of genetic competence, sporulation and motility
MKLLKIIIRLILGVVFTFSGFAKAVDPTGTAIIFTDYFTEAFGMDSMASVSMGLGIVLAAFEFLIGICLIVNVKPRLAALGALIFMVFFTPLTLYIAIANPVKDCGCFGELVKLDNWGTFYKNLVFLPMSVYIFKATKGEHITYKPSVDWSVAIVVFLSVVLFQYYTINHLPLIDARPYKVGIHIPDKMIVPEGEKVDSFATVISMKNLQTGEEKDVTEQVYMETEDYWDIEKWASETKSVLVEKGYEPPIYNFNAYPAKIKFANSGTPTDMMDSLLVEKNFSFFVVAYDLNKADVEGFNKMAALINYAYPKGIKAHLLTSTTTNLMQHKSKIRFPVRIYNSDPTTLKTVIRANPGLLLLKEGTIIGKWHYNDVPTIEEFDKIINNK